MHNKQKSRVILPIIQITDKGNLCSQIYKLNVLNT